MPLESFQKLITLVTTTIARRRCCCLFSLSCCCCWLPPKPFESFRKKITLVITTGNHPRCCRPFFFTVVLLLLVATEAARELSEVNYTCDYYCYSPLLLLHFFHCRAAAAGCHRSRSKVFEKITLVITTGNHRRCCRLFFFTVVMLLLVATDAAREFSEVNYTCDYYCCSPLLLLPFFHCRAAAAGCNRSRSRVFEKITLVITTGNHRHCCRLFFFTVVLLLLAATDAARELSEVN
jgi:hypothetical protein